MTVYKMYAHCAIILKALVHVSSWLVKRENYPSMLLRENWIYERYLSPTSSNGKIFERMNLELKLSHIYYEPLAFSINSGVLIVSIIS